MSDGDAPLSASDVDPVPTTTAPEGGSDLGARTMRGLKWTYLGTVLTAVMQLIYTATMSRLLVPEQFGIFAIGSLSIQFTQYFAQMGVGQAIIQKPELTDEDVRAGWTSSIVLGLVFSGLLALVAPLIADLFREPQATNVLRVFGLSFVFQGLGTTGAALLRRRLRFREHTIAVTAAFFVGFLVVGVPLALAGAGVWSLVVGNLASNVVGSALKYYWSRHTVRLTVRLAPYRQLYSFGSRASLGQFTEFLGNNLDTLAVGRYAVSSMLGQYNRAFYLVNLPLGYLLRSLSEVLFPGFSKIQDDPERLRGVYTRAVATAGTLLVPAAVGLGVAAPDVVGVILGPQWDDAAAVVPILAIAAAGRVMTRFASIAAEARAELNLRLTIQFSHLGLLVAFLAIAAGGSLWGYAAALALAEAIRHTAYLVAMRRVTGVTARDIGRAYGPIAFSSALVAVLIGAVRALGLWLELPMVARFGLEAATGAVALIVAVRFGPLRIVRNEVRRRLTSGQLVATGGWIGRTVSVVLGPDPTRETRPPAEREPS